MFKETKFIVSGPENGKIGFDIIEWFTTHSAYNPTSMYIHLWNGEGYDIYEII